MHRRIVPIVCPYPGTFVQAYYVDAARPALIDTGGTAHPTAEIAAALMAAGTNLDKIDVIINTHGHWDHAGGNAAVQAASGAETWIHALGAPLLTSTAPHIEGYATLQARLLSPITPITSNAAFADLLVPSAPATRLLSDGDRLDLGGVVLTAIQAPGHSDDLLAYFWEEEGILIAADAAQGTGSRVGGCPLYFTSAAEARASIRRLMEIPFRELQVGHPFGRLSTPERTTTYDNAAGRAFLSDSLEALDLMEAALLATIRDQPHATFPATVSAAVDVLRRDGRWTLIDDPGFGLPMGAAVTFDTLWRELGESA